jgi:alkylation response protein AidB-like acyl-CoA dehydrogenase
VDVELSSDQQLFSETAARFIESACPLTKVRELADSPSGLEPEYVRQAGELGWFALLVPEEYGGGSISGHGLADAAIVAEQRGRLLQPGPFVPTNVVAYALSTAADAELRAKVLPALASGEALATWALGDGSGDWRPESGARAARRGGGYVLSGAKGLVHDAGVADWLLVTAAAADGPVEVLVPAGAPGLRVTPLPGLDITRRFAMVDFDDVEVPDWAVVAVEDPAAAIARQLHVALVLTIAESVGAMDRLFDVTLDYAKARTAFGRPIGSFQAIKHLLADVSLLVEASKAGSVAATAAVAHDRDDAPEVASMVKAFVGDSGIDVSQGCLQTHGGIGYTWEHDLHLYLRRLAADSVLYGDPAWHRERVCAIHGL